jgi:hypothetical protein
MLTMTATTLMAEMVMVMAVAMVMMPPLPPLIATMSMTTIAVIQGQQFNHCNWTTTMGRQ